MRAHEKRSFLELRFLVQASMTRSPCWPGFSTKGQLGMLVMASELRVARTVHATTDASN